MVLKFTSFIAPFKHSLGTIERLTGTCAGLKKFQIVLVLIKFISTMIHITNSEHLLKYKYNSIHRIKRVLNYLTVLHYFIFIFDIYEHCISHG